jgi:hypothetical protein
MDKENVVYVHNEILFSHKEEQNCVIFREVDDTGGHRVKRNEPESERQIFSLTCRI